MRFGLFVPQGWRHDLVGIEPAEYWATTSGLAVHADTGAGESIWVYDHFHTVPVPSEQATHEAWSLISACAATTTRAYLGCAIHCFPEVVSDRSGRELFEREVMLALQ
ncbi:LLM class flavin-dependent oxidoreductase [Cryobacterium sp. Y11]|uniref:LLM class flavin-dependent oxidoreductase n=1 Tax=Cryobacterium sp. Y11 TaxID=2045016 RepID=UPI0011B0CF4A